MSFGMPYIIIPEKTIMSTIGFLSRPKRFMPAGVWK
jgi:hypothetical protein